MSITDELREWARGFENVWVKPASKEIVVTTGTSMPVDHVNMRLFIEGMLDRVDAEHERELAEQQDSLTVGMQPMTEENMAEAGWVRGPLDADGEMWHSGDMSDSNWGVIEGIAYEDGRWLVSGHDTSAPWIPADSIRHYHAPTVEDVLREFALACEDAGNAGPEVERIAAEYAAKLRLAGENA